MSQNKISIKVGGPAGTGVFTIGLLLSRYFQRAGLEVVYTSDYPSLIKGGHNTCSVRAEDEKVNSESICHDVLVALDELTIREDLKYLNKGGVLICDEKHNFQSDDYLVIKIPYLQLLKDIEQRYSNTLAFGAVIGLMGEDGFLLEHAIGAHFRKKPEEIKRLNYEAAEIGFNFTREICLKENKGFLSRIKSLNKEEKSIFMSGNDAAALAALKAGVKFVGEYPMTPSSSFLSFFAAHELDYNITTKHTEDEIAAINMVIGAAYSGVRAMTATSGGGFALMNEGLGFAAIAEIPIVVFECMRGGPSTGLPTYTEQGDLKFVINSSQGEFPLLVIAPGDLEEAFYETFEAFNLAEILQTPVVILLDKHLASTQWTSKRFNTKNLKINRGKYIPLNDDSLKDYKRHQFTSDGISPRAFPSQKGAIHVASSYEHDESGWTCEDGRNHELMMEKRFKKLESIPKEKLIPKIYGPQDADLSIVAWGSTKGAILDAIKYLNNDGFKVNYIHFTYINPMDNENVLKILESCKDTIILEANYTGQLRDIIREKTGFYIKNTYFKYDSRPFFFQEIYQKIRTYMENK